MSNKIKHADVLPDGLYVTFKDGREALLDDSQVEDCADKSYGYDKAKDARLESEADARAEEAEARESAGS